MDTKEKILSESFLLFLNKGLKEVTITDIAKKAGIKNGTVYYYFKSKDELIRTVINEFFFSNIDIKRFEKVLFMNCNSKEKISCLFKIVFNQKPVDSLDSKQLNEKIEKYYNHRDLSFFILESIRDYDDISKENYKYILEFKKILIKVVDDGKINNEIRDDIKSEYIAKSIYNHILGSFFSLLLDDNIDLSKEIENNLNIFWLFIENKN